MVLLLLAAAASGVAGRRGIRTCQCKLERNLSQQGKMVGRICYVVGVGRCADFTYEPTAEEGDLPSSPRRLTTRRLGRFPSRRRVGEGSLASAAATASPDQQRRALADSRRRLEAEKEAARQSFESGRGIAQPGTPSFFLAQEKRPSDKALALGNQALAQIYYLQALLGRSGRR